MIAKLIAEHALAARWGRRNVLYLRPVDLDASLLSWTIHKDAMKQGRDTGVLVSALVGRRPSSDIAARQVLYYRRGRKIADRLIPSPPNVRYDFQEPTHERHRLAQAIAERLKAKDAVELQVAA